jgi:hypothetical protein
LAKSKKDGNYTEAKSKKDGNYTETISQRIGPQLFNFATSDAPSADYFLCTRGHKTGVNRCNCNSALPPDA